jgi:hypothetical protein
MDPTNISPPRTTSFESQEAIRELEALRSPEAKQFVQDTYHGAVLATFSNIL